MNRKQFLFTNTNSFLTHFEATNEIGEFTLFLGPESSYSFTKNDDKEIHLIGSMYNWRNPEHRNQDILIGISKHQNLEKIIQSTDQCTGSWILILKIREKILVLNDAAAQQEVYYSDCFSCFATQPKLIE